MFAIHDKPRRLVKTTVAAIAMVTLLAGCGASADVVAPTVQVPTPVPAEEPSGQLSDFLGPMADAVESEEVAEASASEAETVPAPAPAEAEAEAEVPQEPVDDAVEDAVEDAQASPSTPVVSIMPASVPSFGEHTLEVRGAGFPTDAGVFVIFCVVPGDPILAGTSMATLLARLEGLDPIEDCDITNTANTVTDATGAFTAEATGQVEENSLVFAAMTDGSTGAYALVPVSA